MGFLDRAKTTWTDLKGIGRMLQKLPVLRPTGSWSCARLLDGLAAKQPNHVGLSFEDRRWTWLEVNEHVNQYADFFVQQGIGRGDVVAVFMDNRPDYLFAVTALNRIRAIGALINHNLTGRALIHALDIATPKAVLAGSEHLHALDEVLPEMEVLTPGRNVWVQRDVPPGDVVPAGHRVIDDELAGCSRRGLAGFAAPATAEPMCYIYTSGTTGMPKAAIITNQRILVAGTFFGRLLGEGTPRDVIYIALPLYHSNAMYGGWAAALITGASMALRRKFSVSNFWKDIRDFDATIFIYIGELCRYLLNQPPSPIERDHRLRVCIGNGLRPDIWQKFQTRFAIPLIREFYGATEGNAPLANVAGRPGMVGRLRSGQIIVRCDLSTGEILRNAQGMCEPVRPGETGLFLGKITGVMKFDGYVNSGATEQKIVRDVLKKGDRYFNTGDIVKLHEHHWVSFADRIGDTFRWKGENVSTNEVAEILNGAGGVLESNVYGVTVPGADGRAGMASIRIGEAFDLDAFARFVVQELPNFQRPHFIRLQRDMRITSTFKHQKVDYRHEGYDPSKVRDPLYFLDGDRYVPITDDLYKRLLAGDLAPR